MRTNWLVVVPLWILVLIGLVFIGFFDFLKSAAFTLMGLLVVFVTSEFFIGWGILALIVLPFYVLNETAFSHDVESWWKPGKHPKKYGYIVALVGWIVFLVIVMIFEVWVDPSL